MIIDLPDTTTRDINKRLVTARDEGGAIALGRVLTLIIDADAHDPEDAIEAANAASREHPCRIIVLTERTGSNASKLDAQIRLGATPARARSSCCASRAASRATSTPS